MSCITANVLQTKVDAQCDKLATELSYIVVTLPHLYLAPLLRMTPFEFCRDLRNQKTGVPGLSCSVVCVILCLVVSVEQRLVTVRQTDTRLRHIPR